MIPPRKPFRLPLRQHFRTNFPCFFGAILAGAGGFLDAFTFFEKGHVFANAMTGISCFSESRWLKAIGTTQERVFCASFLLGASFVGIVTPLPHNRALWFVSAILIVVCVGLIRKLSASKSA